MGTLKGAFNEYTVGGGGSNSWGSTESKVFLQDIDGDNLPDKVYKKGNKVSYRKNLSAIEMGKFSDEKHLVSLPSLGKTQSYSYSYGVDLQLKRVMLGYNRQISKSTTESYFMDFNGDRLVDFVDRGMVYYNRIENGVPTFSTSSTGTSSPIVSEGSLNIDATPTKEYKKELENKNPLHDIVRTWRVPYTGKISIKHEYQLVEDRSADRQEYQNNDGSLKADGVRLFFQHNKKFVWKEKIGAEDYAKKQKTEVLNVQKGDLLYFRVSSNYDGNYDEVHWNPEIEYTDIPLSSED